MTDEIAARDAYQRSVDTVVERVDEDGIVLARTVFYEWGITATEHFGEIVFNLVSADLLMRNESDTLADFEADFDFEQAFVRDYAPPLPRSLDARSGQAEGS